jgi:hypothetical protein
MIKVTHITTYPAHAHLVLARDAVVPEVIKLARRQILLDKGVQAGRAGASGIVIIGASHTACNMVSVTVIASAINMATVHATGVASNMQAMFRRTHHPGTR